MLYVIAEEAKWINNFILGNIRKILKNASEIALSSILDNLLRLSFEDLNQLSSELHHLRSDGCHTCHVFFDSVDVFFIDFEVLFLLANYNLVGGFEWGD